MAKYFWLTGSLIFLILGAMHLFLTFFTNKFSSINEKMIGEMKVSSPNLSNETTMWKAWIGFNASHATGAIFIGGMNIFIAMQLFSSLDRNLFFLLFNISIVGFYIWLAKKYWFKGPLIGILIAWCCFIISAIISLSA